MEFTHDFRDDLETLDFFAEEPWALSRFADGELAIIHAIDMKAADGWKPVEAAPGVREALRRSLIAVNALVGYYVGISCPCCDKETCSSYRFILSQAHGDTPPFEEKMTFSNIFANANYDRFRQRCLEEKFGARCVIVGSGTPCAYDIPSNLVNHPQAMEIIDALVGRLLDETKTILVAAGPASNIIIHRYWTKCPLEKRRVICDIGSALDPWLHGKFTRGYHDPKHPNRKKVCVWTKTT